jgi:hypothetical protein
VFRGRAVEVHESNEIRVRHVVFTPSGGVVPPVLAECKVTIRRARRGLP